MNLLLHFEFHKLKRQKSFYICTFIIIILIFFSCLTVKMVTGGAPENVANPAHSGIISMIGAVSSSSFLLIAGIFVAILACEDYEQETIKNIFSRGYSRVQVYFSKLVTVLTAVSIMFVVVVLSGFLLGSLYFGVGDTGDYSFIAVLAVQYVSCIANVSLFFVLSAVIQKIGSSIAATIFVPMIVNMVLGLADSFLKLKNFSLTNLWLSSFLNDLIKLPIGTERLTLCLSASLIYFIVFSMMGLYLSKNLKMRQ